MNIVEITRLISILASTIYFSITYFKDSGTTKELVFWGTVLILGLN